MFNAFSVLIVEEFKSNHEILLLFFFQTKNGFNMDDFSLSDLDPLAAK
jgi:hypothetical protein